MKSFMFNSTELAILKNFAAINPSLVIKPDGFYVRSADHLVAIYRFENPYDFKQFGLYETQEFISILNAYKTPTIEVFDTYVNIFDSDTKAKYFTTPLELVNYYQKFKGESVDPYCNDTKLYRIETNFKKVNFELEFLLSQEKLSMLLKMANLYKAQFIFFESDVDNSLIRITIGDSLESSQNTWELEIKNESEIFKNNLSSIMKGNVAQLRMIQSDYKVRVSSEGASEWTSVLNPVYFIGLSQHK